VLDALRAALTNGAPPALPAAAAAAAALASHLPAPALASLAAALLPHYPAWPGAHDPGCSPAADSAPARPAWAAALGVRLAEAVLSGARASGTGQGAAEGAPLGAGLDGPGAGPAERHEVVAGVIGVLLAGPGATPGADGGDSSRHGGGSPGPVGRGGSQRADRSTLGPARGLGPEPDAAPGAWGGEAAAQAGAERCVLLALRGDWRLATCGPTAAALPLHCCVTVSLHCVSLQPAVAHGFLACIIPGLLQLCPDPPAAPKPPQQRLLSFSPIEPPHCRPAAQTPRRHIAGFAHELLAACVARPSAGRARVAAALLARLPDARMRLPLLLRAALQAAGTLTTPRAGAVWEICCACDLVYVYKRAGLRLLVVVTCLRHGAVVIV